MGTIIRSINTILFLLMLTLGVYGQKEPLISGSFSSLSFENWVNEVESQTPFRFYFKTEVVDTITVTLEADRNTLPELLDRLFANTDFNYAIDSSQRVFITYGWEIQSQLPKGFFGTPQTEPRPDIKPEERDVLIDYFQADRKQTDKGNTRLYEIGVRTNTLKEGNATLSGRILDERTGEPIIGANVFVKNPLIGTATDPLGYYSLSLPR
ncbi:MAG: carboxypeptidase-like regulatory domain-containing protein, partial [Owenweeksia sp.]